MPDLPDRRPKPPRDLPEKYSRRFLAGLGASAFFDLRRFSHPLFLREMSLAKGEAEEDLVMDKWMAYSPEQLLERDKEWRRIRLNP